MYIILLEYTQGLEPILKYLDEHLVFLDKYFSRNQFICSGAQSPRTGGVILCNASSKEEVHQIIAEDPFHIHEVANYEIIEFNPTKFAPGFEAFVPTKEY